MRSRNSSEQKKKLGYQRHFLLSMIVNKDLDNNASKRALALSSFRRQLTLLLIIRCLRNAHIAQPILVPFYSSSVNDGGIGLSVPNVLWLGSMYSFFVTVSEIPSGYLADRLGRRRTLQLSFLGLGLSLLVPTMIVQGNDRDHDKYSVSWTTLVVLIVSQIFRAVGSALFSGTDMALLYEILSKYNKLQQQQKKPGKNSNIGSGGNNTEGKVLDFESKHVFFMTVTEAFSSALGGILSKVLGLRATVAIAAVPFVTGFFVCLLLEKEENNEEGKKTGDALTGSQTNNSSTHDNNDNRNHDRNNTMKVEVDKKNKNGIGTCSETSLSLTSLVDPTISKEVSSTNKFANKTDVDHVPPMLRTIFIVGIGLNCATYMANTALNPLLYAATGIPVLHFGWISSMNGMVTAVAALFSSSLRNFVSSSLSSLKTASNSKEKGRDSSVDDTSTTEGLLLLLLTTSMVAYGIMALSAQISSSSPGGHNNNQEVLCRTTMIARILSVCASILFSMVRGVAWPVLGTAINAAVRENGSRATTLSLFSGAIKAATIGIGLVNGFLLDYDRKNNSNQQLLLTGSASTVLPRGLFYVCALNSLILTLVGTWLILKRERRRTCPTTTTVSAILNNNRSCSRKDDRDKNKKLQ